MLTLLVDMFNIRYMTGFTGSLAYAVYGDDFSKIYVDSRYFEQAKNEVGKWEVCLCNNFDDVLDKISLNDIRELSIEYHSVTVSVYQKIMAKFSGIKITNASAKLALMRIKKSEDEIKKIRRAVKIADMAFDHIIKFIIPGIFERDIAIELEYFMKKNGADGIAFDTISVSGPKTSMPHAQGDYTCIREGVPIIMDFGCIVEGYCSDITRTVFCGNANAVYVKMYNAVLKGQTEGIHMAKAGMKCSALHNEVVRIIEKEGFKKPFGHSLGHGVGLEVHELPRLSPASSDLLAPGMVVTIEPGIYIPGFGGIRIEDVISIRDNNTEVLTKADKTIKIL
jgi:Xaa-Pro aminopeptidase